MATKNILETVQEKIELKVRSKHIPAEFFKDRKGLYVWNSFIENIVKNSAPTEENSEFKIASFDLKEDSLDKDIEKALPEKHLFSETEVCAVIAALIEKQPKGEKGLLLNNGYANLFYTKARVVGVGWGGSWWDVDGWERDVDKWGAGLRVFSSATEI